MNIITTTLSAQGASSSTSSMLWMYLFIVVFVVFIIYTIILMYHWFSFSLYKDIAIRAAVIYLTISSVFIFYIFTTAIAL